MSFLVRFSFYMRRVLYWFDCWKNCDEREIMVWLVLIFFINFYLFIVFKRTNCKQYELQNKSSVDFCVMCYFSSYLHCKWATLEELEKDPRIHQKIKRFRTKQAQMKHLFTEVTITIVPPPYSLFRANLLLDNRFYYPSKPLPVISNVNVSTSGM